MSRFPLRTVILMTMALFAFAWLWWRSHPPAKAPRPAPLRFQLIDAGDGGLP